MVRASRPLAPLPLLVLFLATRSAFPLDLRAGLAALESMTWTRSGAPEGSPGPQLLRVTPHRSGDPLPGELAAAEKKRRRKKNRRAHVWAGFLGTHPTWTVSGEVLTGPPQAARIRRRLEFWSLVPGGWLAYLRADSPGGLGRRRAEKRFLFLLRQLGRLRRGEIRDPFREIRLSPEGSSWQEEVRLRLPGGLRVHLRGPVPEPLPPLPTEPTGHLLFGRYPFEGSLPGAPERFHRGTVPGYLVRFTPGFPSRRQQMFLVNLLGVSSGVGVAPGSDLENLAIED